ncbi:hypothetical protein NIES2135_54240 [Leptolyngbya boryana NIES-2135]|uniref:Uncharacterized protein n=1 Tax=Leptolyngbya boryana NIES-2135 TaxID=1973484 RepID=A0A1Z4JP59_LEPBY|nr:MULTISPECIES: hypothetical protein [Leptolyngbya]BAY58551.1 hypothetical protein NIES2135_54240 [Leptolyngbya boryana NIES-2135]MBD2370772.1 hypothetical protein [Leptolyngbya sp. FACHB-161]MBD2377075.1 hypothetical protein [Leptolyngbya sp. FACHB-238]MBD2401518.1 hypothetical protein [Leptolyngbya sp. FACHB-239]MBD2408070.1 hypothetical protein [Leptolyngbya sp. FACHB-402]
MSLQSVFTARFQEIICRDRRLSRALIGFHQDLQDNGTRIIYLRCKPNDVYVLTCRLLKITQRLLALGTFERIVITDGFSDRVFEVADLIALCPAIETPYLGSRDRASQMERRRPALSE